MLFTSPEFAIFFLITSIIYYLPFFKTATHNHHCWKFHFLRMELLMAYWIASAIN
ncbi:MAG: hypothetical protein CLLPBCKN_005580 [Chroococcidiopsis cubana SAG 39.79]|nr:hypothetical protein [Chroococcidiopsis cubana SAG 39.79]